MVAAVVMGCSYGIYVSVDFALITEVLPGAEDRAVRLRLGPGARWVAEYYRVDRAVERDGALEVTLPTKDLAWVAKLILRLGGEALGLGDGGPNRCRSVEGGLCVGQGAPTLDAGVARRAGMGDDLLRRTAGLAQAREVRGKDAGRERSKRLAELDLGVDDVLHLGAARVGDVVEDESEQPAPRSGISTYEAT